MFFLHTVLQGAGFDHQEIRYFQTSNPICEDGGIPPNVLQPTEAYCANPAFGSPIHLQRRST
jgi:hypothetical protein